MHGDLIEHEAVYESHRCKLTQPSITYLLLCTLCKPRYLSATLAPLYVHYFKKILQGNSVFTNIFESVQYVIYGFPLICGLCNIFFHHLHFKYTLIEQSVQYAIYTNILSRSIQYSIFCLVGKYMCILTLARSAYSD